LISNQIRCRRPLLWPQAHLSVIPASPISVDSVPATHSGLAPPTPASSGSLPADRRRLKLRRTPTLLPAVVWLPLAAQPPLRCLPRHATIKGATPVAAAPFFRTSSPLSFLRTSQAPSSTPSASCPPRSTGAPPPPLEPRLLSPPLQPHGEPHLQAISYRSELLLTSPVSPSSCRTPPSSTRAT
jgi:hypothetical protein